MERQTAIRFFVAASVLLFFLQSLRAVFSGLFGIIYDQVFLGPIDGWLFAMNGLLLLAFLAPIFAPASPRRNWSAACAVLVAVARLGLSVNDPNVRVWSSLIGLAFGGLYLALLIAADRPLVLNGLLMALVLDQLLRVVGQSYDLGLRPTWLPAQTLWTVLLLAAAVWLGRRVQPGQRVYGVPGALWGLAMGGLLFLETSLLSLPNAVARWSNTSYALVAPLLLALTFLPLIPGLRPRILALTCRRRGVRLVLGLLLAVAIQVGYFLQGPLAALALLSAQALALAALICLLDGPAGPLKSPGPRLALGLLFLGLLNFLNAFTFTYPYVLPAMRGLGWAIYLVATLACGIGWVLQPSAKAGGEVLAPERPWMALAGAALALAITIWAVWPRPADALPDDAGSSLRAGTYNIHYGYNTTWQFTLEDIAQTIQTSDADIVALQEVDTGRMTSHGVDNAYYLARRLDMNVAYLPTVEHLTGIALLYRGRAEAIDSRLLTSLQEQTGIIHVRLDAAQRPLDAYGIWMGLSDEDTQRQIDEALAFIGPASPATFGGDFNAQPDSPVIQTVLQAGFDDPFLLLGIDPSPPTSPAISPETRIDYVFMRGLAPLQAEVLPSLASDHRMVMVEYAWPP